MRTEYTSISNHYNSLILVVLQLIKLGKKFRACIIFLLKKKLITYNKKALLQAGGDPLN